MEQTPSQCWHCGADTTRDRAAGLTYCSGCGRGWVPDSSVANGQPTTPLDADDAADRRRWMICFWLCFLLTPAATFLTWAGIPTLIRLLPGSSPVVVRMLGGYAVLGMFAVGTLSTSYCLLRYRNMQLTPVETIGHMLWNFVVVVVGYVGVMLVAQATLNVLIR